MNPLLDQRTLNDVTEQLAARIPADRRRCPMCGEALAVSNVLLSLPVRLLNNRIVHDELYVTARCERCAATQFFPLASFKLAADAWRRLNGGA